MQLVTTEQYVRCTLVPIPGDIRKQIRHFNQFLTKLKYLALQELMAGHSIECKLAPATRSPLMCFCTLWPCDLDLWTWSVQRVRCSTFGCRSFASAGPTVWNPLPNSLRNPAVGLEQFRRTLKWKPTCYLFYRFVDSAFDVFLRICAIQMYIYLLTWLLTLWPNINWRARTRDGLSLWQVWWL